jgi:hypothetical protein
MSQAVEAQSFATSFPYQPARGTTIVEPGVVHFMSANASGSVGVTGCFGGSVFSAAGTYMAFVGLSDGHSKRSEDGYKPVVDLLRARFAKLVVEWKASKGPISSITAMAMLPSYQQIIGIGAPAVPLILKQLKSEGDQPDMWFWALKAITGDDPVSESDRGDVVAMADAWLAWGFHNGVS